jgi:hypothetical protein
MGSFIWGLIGAWLGQIHMSGFFFAAALFLWTALFGRGHVFKLRVIEWKYWFLGSVLGALPLIPWFIYVIQNPIHQSMSAGWGEILQFKYWSFWFTNPTGLHLGNPLGLLRGTSNWQQISDFVRYPILNGHATYLTGLAHLVAGLATLAIFHTALRDLWSKRKQPFKQWTSLGVGKSSETAFVQNSALWGCGILLTATGVVIRRYYMNVTFPLEFICLVRMANPHSSRGVKLLAALWIAELLISINFVGYVHVNQGSTQGDYGPAYHVTHPAPKQ